MSVQPVLKLSVEGRYKTLKAILAYSLCCTIQLYLTKSKFNKVLKFASFYYFIHSCFLLKIEFQGQVNGLMLSNQKQAHKIMAFITSI